MTSESRREKIEKMLEQDPHDQFLRYAFAMELDKAGEHEKSLEVFRGLMQDQQPHVPSFLMAAQQLVRLEQVTEARAVLREGIEAARRQGNAHAAGEMGELLAGLGAQGG